MLYVAVGDDRDWKRYSVKKPVDDWQADTGSGQLSFSNSHQITWQARHPCTITTAYLVDGTGRTINKMKLGREVSVRRYDWVDMPAGELVIDVIFNCEESPYLV